MKYLPNYPTYIEHFKKFEGNANHFYLDGPGYVTLGIGCVISDPSNLKMFLKSNNTAVTHTEVMNEFQAVKMLFPGKNLAYYDKVCRLYMLEKDIIELFKAKLNQFIVGLEEQITILEPYPDKAVLVLVDMAFNLGLNGLMHKFPNFLHAFLKKDWLEASMQCERKGIQKERNEWTKETLFSLCEVTK